MTRKIIATNKRARFDYFIEDVIEAGLVLTGSEIKSIRAGHVSINEAFVSEEKGELFLMNASIEDYKFAGRFNHDPRRPRKLLLRKREANRLFGLIQRKGMTVIPVSLYYTQKGLVKAELGTAKGKKQVDKRATIKERDWNRDKARVLKGER